MAQAKPDDNNRFTLSALSSTDSATPVGLEANATTKRLLVSIDGTATEDAVHASGDTGMMVLGVRQDTQSDFGADGDYVPLSIDGDGALRVSGGGGGTQYAVDSALGATPTGTVAIAIRDDALSALTPVEGDAIGLRVDANGALWTHDDALDAALAGSELQVDVVGALPAGTNAIGKLAANSGVDIGDVDILSIAAGDNNIGNVDLASAIPAGTNAIGKLAANSGVDIGDVDVTSVIPGTGATNLGKAIDTATGGTDTGVLILATRDDALSALTPIEGDNIQLRVDANGALWTHDDALDAAIAGSELQVDVVGALPAGTNAIGKLAANSGVDIGDVDVLSIAAGDNNIGNVDIVSGTVTTVSTLTGGGVAHDAADSGNPHKIGAKAETSLKGITLVADGDRTDLYADSDGVLIVKHWTSGVDRISERVSNTDGASTGFSTFSAVASTFNNITDITIHNAHATTNGFVDIRDGTAGSVLWTFPAPANGGVTHHFDPPLKQPTANTALAFDVSAAITTIYISVNGFQSKV